MEPCFLNFANARHGRGHTDEWIVDVDRTERTDFLHMIGAATRDGTEIEDGAQRLEIAHAIISELRRERVGIVIKPGGLDIHHHSQPRGLLDRFTAHEIGMTDAWARRTHGRSFIHFSVRIEQGVDCAISNSVRGELQTVFYRSADQWNETVFWDETHAAVLRISDRVDFAQAPGLAHVRAASEH